MILRLRWKEEQAGTRSCHEEKEGQRTERQEEEQEEDQEEGTNRPTTVRLDRALTANLRVSWSSWLARCTMASSESLAMRYLVSPGARSTVNEEPRRNKTRRERSRERSRERDRERESYVPWQFVVR